MKALAFLLIMLLLPVAGLLWLDPSVGNILTVIAFPLYVGVLIVLATWSTR